MKFGIDWPCGLNTEKMFENADHIHVYSLWAGAETPGSFFFIISISQYSPLLQVFPH